MSRVAEWLKSAGLDQFVSNFNDIDEDQFLSLQVCSAGCGGMPASLLASTCFRGSAERRELSGLADTFCALRHPQHAHRKPEHFQVMPDSWIVCFGGRELVQMQDYADYKVMTQEDRRKLFSLLQVLKRELDGPKPPAQV